jgi:hypothetical protein
MFKATLIPKAKTQKEEQHNRRDIPHKIEVKTKREKQAAQKPFMFEDQ